MLEVGVGRNVKIETSIGIAKRALDCLARELEEEQMIYESEIVRGQIVVINSLILSKNKNTVYETTPPGPPLEDVGPIGNHRNVSWIKKH